MKCKNCIYFAELAGDFDGEAHHLCRRFPPITIVEDNYTNLGWPRVEGADWCGEFKQENSPKE